MRSVVDQVHESIAERGRVVKVFRDRSRVDGVGKDGGGTPVVRQGREERDREEKSTVRFEESKAERTSWRAGSEGPAITDCLLSSTTSSDTVEGRGE